ncbi:H-NS family nucleoid-associated regulatory protein [Paraburkholderia sp. B3]|uniref:H-NS histone family protein n=1 Tax=Paraburkholderia sp. B3 TaxID=3134791 RepID=UPI00398217CB
MELSNLSYRELLAESERIAERIKEQYAIERDAAIRTCAALVKEFDLTGLEVGTVRVQSLPSKRQPKAARTFSPALPKRTLPALYRDPETGRTWSGRGHQPQWITGDKADYLIERADEKHVRVTQNNRYLRSA